jgi:hypothetical protein
MKSLIATSIGLFAAFVFGLMSVHPIAKAVEEFSVTQCGGASPCSGGVNASTGSGVVGGSEKGDGVTAWTRFPSTGPGRYRAGLLGQDLSASGTYDAGVSGSSKRGVGILGMSLSGAGVLGRSSSGNGVVGQTSMLAGSSGVRGQDLSTQRNSANSGVSGYSASGYGVVGTATANGTGVYASSNSGNGLQVISNATSVAAILAQASGGGDIIDGAGSGNTSAFYVDTNANVHTTGLIYSEGSCQNGCSRRHRVRSYGMSSAVPTIEDNGEARLLGGAVSVPLDPAFANAIDPQQGYIVQITPEGDTRGLYVASRTPNAFVVRETMGGRASISFAYRIVAHPYDVRAARLPFVEPRTPSTRR